MSRTMTLRSACKGDCEPQENNDHTSGPSKQKSNHHSHHHHHSHNHKATGSENLKDTYFNKTIHLLDDSIESVSNKTSSLVETATNWRFFKSISSSIKSVGGETSTSFIKHSSPAKKVTYNISKGGKQSAAVSSNNSSHSASYKNGTKSIRTRNVSKYSDYSSGDELDFESVDKTDYTYAKSSSYRYFRRSPDSVPFPNMSRRSLRSCTSDLYGENSYSYLLTSKNNNHTGYANNDAFESSQIGNRHGYNYPDSDYEADDCNNITYKKSIYGKQTQFQDNDVHSLYSGLDSDSEIEDFEIKQRSRSNMKSRNASSFLKIWFNLFDCVVPITTLWERVWSMVYWMICSILLLDGWILSRKIGKKWIFLPLLILLLWLLSDLLTDTDSTNTIYEYFKISLESTKDAVQNSIFFIYKYIQHLAEVLYLSTASLIAYFQVDKSSESEVSTSAKFFSPQKTHNNEIPVHVQSELSHEQVEKIVRSIISEEMMHLSLQMKKSDATQSEQSVQQNQMFEVQKQRLSTLHMQIQGILEQQEVLSDQLKRTKDNFMHEQHDNTAGIIQIRNLEKEMDLMKDNINWLQENQALLEASMRNCCRNNTYNSAVVEDEVAAILLQVMGQKSDSGKMRSEFNGFSQWLKNSIVSDVERFSRDADADTMHRAEAVARLAAAAAVRDTLKQQEDRLGAIHTSGKLSEMEVRKIVRDAIAIYDADKTGLPDYALESAGGTILSTRCSETYNMGTAQLSFLGIPIWTNSYSPRSVIQPDVRPGECWAFKGSEGYLVIQLMGRVRPTAFSLEHIPRLLSPNGNIDSAPKEFSVFGLLQEKQLDGTFIGRYHYDIDGEPLQYFPVADPNLNYFPIIELRIHSNHGNLDYTCLYRFRVHGVLKKQ